MSSEFQVVIFLGRSGSGKGTQVAFLQERYPAFERISSGSLLRARQEQDDYTGRTISAVLEKGGLIPTPVIFKLWMDKLQELKESGEAEGIIMEGSPRKYYEARLLDEALDFFGWKGNTTVFHINVSQKEAKRRLLERGRGDDTEEAIESRLGWFEEEVVPVIEFYREKGLLSEIDGEQPPRQVFADIKHVIEESGQNG